MAAVLTSPKRTPSEAHGGTRRLVRWTGSDDDEATGLAMINRKERKDADLFNTV
jgi:hypothetical protein